MAPDYLKRATMPAGVARTLVSAASRLVSTLFPALRQASRPVSMRLLKHGCPNDEFYFASKRQ